MVIGGFQNITKIPELKKRIIISFLLLAVYRLGCHIPTPGIDAAALVLSSAPDREPCLVSLICFQVGLYEGCQLWP